MKVKKLLAALAMIALGLALIVIPVLATAHEQPGTCRAPADCHSLEPSQQRACRDCVNRGGGYHYHPNTGTCHANQRPRKNR